MLDGPAVALHMCSYYFYARFANVSAVAFGLFMVVMGFALFPKLDVVRDGEAGQMRGRGDSGTWTGDLPEEDSGNRSESELDLKSTSPEMVRLQETRRMVVASDESSQGSEVEAQKRQASQLRVAEVVRERLPLCPGLVGDIGRNCGYFVPRRSAFGSGILLALGVSSMPSFVPAVFAFIIVFVVSTWRMWRSYGAGKRKATRRTGRLVLVLMCGIVVGAGVCIGVDTGLYSLVVSRTGRPLDAPVITLWNWWRAAFMPGHGIPFVEQTSG